MDKFFDLVDSAIALSHESRARLESLGINTIQHRVEFCTVKLSCGRAVGKTKYIVTRARPWDVVIVMNEMMRRNFPGGVTKVYTVRELLEPSPWFNRGREIVAPRTIYVDEGGSLTPNEIGRIWAPFSCHPDQTMVVLG